MRPELRVRDWATITVLVLIALSAWIFLDRARLRNRLPRTADLGEIDFSSAQSPFPANDWRNIHWEAFRVVRPLHDKAHAEDQDLSADEIRMLIELTRHESSLIRARALTGLFTDDPELLRQEVIAAMCNALAAPDELTICYALAGLKRLQAHACQDQLITLLEHPSGKVRTSARETLAEFGYRPEVN